VVILADTSAWIEYFRATESEVDLRVDALIRAGDMPATTDAVLMEMLGGARSIAHRQELRSLLYHCPYLSVQAPADYESAAAIYARCRRRGVTVRSFLDCLISVVAIRTGAAVLHRNGDFQAIARHSALILA
jgi:predicted nucleic acid-binding protein